MHILLSHSLSRLSVVHSLSSDGNCMAMDPSLVEFFLFITKLINLHNTLLIMTEEQTFPMSFCNGMSFPVICSQYPESESGLVLEKLVD